MVMINNTLVSAYNHDRRISKYCLASPGIVIGENDRKSLTASRSHVIQCVRLWSPRNI